VVAEDQIPVLTPGSLAGLVAGFDPLRLTPQSSNALFRL
jgi:hypothetical protein